MVEDGQTEEYAYSWYINEEMLQEPTCLNQPSFFKMFTQPGKYIVRVVVSNMRGGVVSQNLELIVDGEEYQNLSTVSGTVRSSQGSIQGARVLIEPAPIIEHNVSVIGDLKHNFPNGKRNHYATRLMEKLVDILMRRGEVHRFYFDSTTDYPMVFQEEPEKLHPGSCQYADGLRADTNKGGQYFRNLMFVTKLKVVTVPIDPAKSETTFLC